MTQNADTIFVTIRLVPVSMKLIQKATAAKMAPTVPLHMGHMTCVALFMISGAISIPILFRKNSQTLVLCVCDFDFHCLCLISREMQVIESQGGAGATECDGQSGQAASTALIEKIVSEEPRWQGNQCFNITFTEHTDFLMWDFESV